VNPSYEPNSFDPDTDLEPQGLPDFLRDPWGMFRRRWVSSMLVLALGVLATMAFVSHKEPVYEAAATVLITTQQIPERFVRSTVPVDGAQRVNAMITEVLARSRLVELVEKYDLYADHRDDSTLAEIVEMVREDVSIEVPPGLGKRARGTTHLFTIGFTAHSPEVAANVANELAGRLTNASFRLRNQQAKLTSDFLRTELVRTESALREQNARVTAFKEQYRGELPGDLRWNLQQVERLHQRRQDLTLRRAEASTQLELFQAQIASGESDRSPDQLRLEALREALVRERGVLMDAHPNVQALHRQIATLEDEISAADGFWSTEPSTHRTTNVLLTGSRRSLAAYDAEIEEIAAKLDLAERRIAQAPHHGEKLSELVEREGVLRERYLEFLRKVEEADVAANLESAQQGERISILDRAEPPTAPTRERWKYLVAGLVAAFGGAFVIAAIGEIADPVVLNEDQLERVSRLVSLGSVPRIA